MEKQTRYFLTMEPKGPEFRALLEFGSQYCPFFLLVIRSELKQSPGARQFMAELEPYLVSVDETNKWPGTILLSDTAMVSKFKLVPETIDLLVGEGRGFYEWTQPELPEDPCLLRSDGSSWVSSTAHERIGCFEVREAEEKALLNHPIFGRQIKK